VRVRPTNGVIVTIAIVATSMGCGETDRATRQTLTAVAHEVFTGVLPCADCGGIHTELRLYVERPTGRPVRYEMSQTYLATRDGDRTLKRAGRWTILRGSADDRNATVYQLDFDDSARQQSFLRVDDDELRQLDRLQQELSSSAPHSLHRVSQPSSSAALTLSEADSGRTIDIAAGQRVAIQLRANHTTGYRWILATPLAGVLVRLGEATYERDTVASNSPGAGGIETWSFQASRPGQEDAHFEYRRSWERDGPAARSVRYTIRVR
jgi:copper homeostasis protein (lipoprotein)